MIKNKFMTQITMVLIFLLASRPSIFYYIAIQRHYDTSIIKNYYIWRDKSADVANKMGKIP